MIGIRQRQQQGLLCTVKLAQRRSVHSIPPFCNLADQTRRRLLTPRSEALSTFSRSRLSSPPSTAMPRPTVAVGPHQSQPSQQPQQHSPRRGMGTWTKVRPKRVRVITCDVTGTLVSFRGSLEQHYLGSARKAGIALDPHVPIGQAFGRAYKEMSRRFPCFGGAHLSAKEWWKRCVLRSFELAGVVNMTEDQREAVFQRIYSRFGSLAAYERFDDTLPFLRFVEKHHMISGVLSNADERYGDSILPMLGVTHDELHFQCFSKDFGIEKPDTRFFMAALAKAENFIFNPEDPLLPAHCLHIGNDYVKDFEGARRAGMHAVLLNRYQEDELAAEWKRRGAIVFEDLLDIILWLGESGCRLG